MMRFGSRLMLGGSGGLRSQSGGVLEDALGAGVMKELFAAHQALRHRHLAPGAEAVRQSVDGYF